MGQKETAITRQIRDYLNIRRIFHWKNWSGIGSAPGIPDIIGVLPKGRLFAIEVKTEKGRVSDKQQAFIDNINNNGGCAFVARDIQDVIDKGF